MTQPHQIANILFLWDESIYSGNVCVYCPISKFQLRDWLTNGKISSWWWKVVSDAGVQFGVVKGLFMMVIVRHALSDVRQTKRRLQQCQQIENDRLNDIAQFASDTDSNLISWQIWQAVISQ